jgi:hypothetical protein
MRQVKRQVSKLNIVQLLGAALLSGCGSFVIGLESYIETEETEGMSFGMTEDGEFVPDSQGGGAENDSSDGSGSGDPDMEPEEDYDEGLCEDAAEHLDSCGESYSMPSVCDRAAAHESEVILELECSELETALVWLEL